MKNDFRKNGRLRVRYYSSEERRKLLNVVAQNYPYSGCYVPNSAMTGENDCFSIMLEFNKRVYLDDNRKIKEEKAESIRDVIRKIITDCVCLDDRSINANLKSEIVWETMKGQATLDL